MSEITPKRRSAIYRIVYLATGPGPADQGAARAWDEVIAPLLASALLAYAEASEQHSDPDVLTTWRDVGRDVRSWVEAELHSPREVGSE
jgi:hypothetical protein